MFHLNCLTSILIVVNSFNLGAGVKTILPNAAYIDQILILFNIVKYDFLEKKNH